MAYRPAIGLSPDERITRLEFREQWEVPVPFQKRVHTVHKQICVDGKHRNQGAP